LEENVSSSCILVIKRSSKKLTQRLNFSENWKTLAFKKIIFIAIESFSATPEKGHLEADLLIDVHSSGAKTIFKTTAEVFTSQEMTSLEIVYGKCSEL